MSISSSQGIKPLWRTAPKADPPVRWYWIFSFSQTPITSLAISNIYRWYCFNCPSDKTINFPESKLSLLKTDTVDYLFDAILSLETKEECYDFFEDLCTVNELLSLSQRFEVASMLRNHKTYLEIAEKTGASTATISRVNRSLNYGNDGYDMVFGRLEGKENE